MTDTKSTVELVVTDGGTTAVPAPLPPEVAAEPSVVRRYVRSREKTHASTPKELAAYIEYHFIDLIEQPGATPEQQFAALRELAKFPKVGLTPGKPVAAVRESWMPSAETEDILERL